MSFLGIVSILLLVLIALCIIFAMFHIIFMLLPAIIVIALIIWLINYFTKGKDNSSANQKKTWNTGWANENSPKHKRKKVRDAETKDVDK
ncbi:hypothetical protein SAMN04487792_0922 [Lactobacillus bombicola]|jgi:predicted membrane protein|uniref:Uncharacterized protein n=1 Tax=Lactobacillus bombicola TaxID=1505723 RepID=A0A1I1SL31_9LACO|nr:MULTISPECIES: hypothetical protein [Lactobacillus]MCO6527697.1 hypothetical protein [Lactobacillus sp.]RHW49078.1 hypothetical protein DS833_06125 [Lactobacillus bombicola]RHW53472.1 hypothetical protein DS834_00610 [Lactobacillus bombicola]RMC42195.1 hypothetical protein F5ESL0233_02505 [Lactobacillus sp. ESL0233]SFD45388.1 hypothetical protein SAMN04487792_0922 [Lactobacillus bombicola]